MHGNGQSFTEDVGGLCNSHAHDHDFAWAAVTTQDSIHIASTATPNTLKRSLEDQKIAGGHLNKLATGDCCAVVCHAISHTLGSDLALGWY